MEWRVLTHCEGHNLHSCDLGGEMQWSEQWRGVPVEMEILGVCPGWALLWALNQKVLGVVQRQSKNTKLLKLIFEGDFFLEVPWWEVLALPSSPCDLGCNWSPWHAGRPPGSKVLLPLVGLICQFAELQNEICQLLSAGSDLSWLWWFLNTVKEKEICKTLYNNKKQKRSQITSVSGEVRRPHAGGL